MMTATPQNLIEVINSNWALIESDPTMRENIDRNLLTELLPLYDSNDEVRKIIDQAVNAVNVFVSVKSAKGGGKGSKKNTSDSSKTESKGGNKTGSKNDNKGGNKDSEKDHKEKPAKYDSLVNFPAIQVRLAERFVKLQGKPFDSANKNKAINLLKTLQKAIVNHDIRSEGHGEASAYANEMRRMQEKLVKMANLPCDASKTINIDGVEDFRKVAKAEGSMSSTNVMRSFVSMQGRDNEKTAQSLLKRVDKVLDSGEAGKYADVCRQIKESLTDFTEGRTHVVEALPQTLDGIGNALGGGRKGGTLAKKAVVSADALFGAHFSTLPLTGKWARIVGRPSLPYKVMIYGNAGSGKSTLALQFAGYLAEAMGQKVLYWASEEGIGYGIQDKLRRLGIRTRSLNVCAKLPKNITDYDVVFIDSVNHAGIDADGLRGLPQSVSYVYVFQATKNGSFRGTNDYLHDVDASIRVENFRAYAEKNRFGAKGECGVDE